MKYTLIILNDIFEIWFATLFLVVVILYYVCVSMHKHCKIAPIGHFYDIYNNKNEPFRIIWERRLILLRRIHIQERTGPDMLSLASKMTPTFTYFIWCKYMLLIFVLIVNNKIKALISNSIKPLFKNQILNFSSRIEWYITKVFNTFMNYNFWKQVFKK